MVPGDPNELWHRLGGPSRHLGGHGCLEGGGVLLLVGACGC